MKTAFVLLLTTLLPGATTAIAADRVEADPWSQVPAILNRIRAPEFAKRRFYPRDYGVLSEGADCTSPIQKAIDACSGSGGGQVVLPRGRYLTGPLRLKTGVELRIPKGTVLSFKTDPEAYLPAVLTSFEGMDCYNYSPLIYALDEQNIALTGEGVLDGQADDSNWWKWKGKSTGSPGPTQKAARDRLVRMTEQNIPLDQRRFGNGDNLRPCFIEFYRCRNVLLQGVQIRRSPMWEIHPLLCTNVIVREVHISSHGPNNDGCDPESSRDVLIERCLFDTGDDCIAIKSGRNNDGRRRAVPSENIIVRRCTMRDGHGGVTIGSEISGGCSNVFVELSKMDSPNLERALRIKSNAVRGGTVENVYMRKVQVGQLADSLLQIDFLYEEGPNGPYMPTVRNVIMDRIQVEHAQRAANVRGFAGAEIRNVQIRNSRFKLLSKQDIIEHADVQFLGCRRADPTRN